MVVALCAALFAVWLFGWSSNLNPVDAVLGHPRIVEVPDLSGLARPRAEADVRSADLRPEVSTVLSLEGVKGAVVSQDPQAGTEVDEDSVVHLVVSRGVPRVKMPDAVGEPLEEVVRPLRRAHVDYEVKEVASEEVADGVVISQEPGAGRLVTRADDVVFVVSSGPVPRPVPDVSGLGGEGAAYALGLAGFTVEPELRDGTGVRAGIVIGTEPGAGSVEPRDSTVKLVISAGPPPEAVPDVVGLPLDTAVEALESTGLVPNLRGGGASGAEVVSVDPRPGTLLREGALVDVVAGGG